LTSFNPPLTGDGLPNIPQGTGQPSATNWVTAMNFGPAVNTNITPPPVYWEMFAGSNPRNNGPGSDHSGNLVIHSYGDNHTVSLAVGSTDPKVYFALITRNGNETGAGQQE
jgi:hypothetical protein